MWFFLVVLSGTIAGGLYLIGVEAMKKWRIDDVVMAVPVHLFCGSWGAIAVALFATENGIRGTYDVDKVYTHGLFYGGNFKLLGIQVPFKFQPLFFQFFGSILSKVFDFYPCSSSS